ncbi:hypothetical protein GWI34_30190 [Actinomadura sp. DSM 109109]|nr:hypothetical protein [Actinomadura lepetitiana]
MAALRAQLTGRLQEHWRLLRKMDDASAERYLALVTAAFFEAAIRRFASDGTPAEDAEIAEFVASVRGRLGQPDELNPQVAETVIKVAIDKLPAEDQEVFGKDACTSARIILLTGMVSAMAPAQLEELLNAARQMTDMAFY